METVYFSLFEKVQIAAKEMPNHSLYADEHRDYSTNNFYFATIEAANFLAAQGIQKGDLVFLRATRSIDSYLLFAALTYLGALTALSDPHQGVLEAAELYELKGKTKFALTNEFANEDISAVGDWELLHLEDGSKVACPISLGKEAVEPAFDPKADIYAPSFIIFTSGSSQKAKAVVSSQFSFHNHIENALPSSSGTPEDCILMLLPVHHVFGLALMAMGLWAHYRVYFAPSMDLPVALAAIAKEKVTAVDCVPSYIAAIGKAKEEYGLDLPTLRLSMLGGTSLLDEEVQYIQRSLGVRVIPVYGMSECIGIAGAGFDEPEEVRCHSVGHVLPMCDVKLIDDRGNEVPKGEKGEIIVKSITMMLGYYDNPEATNEAIDAQGYLHTGDIGQFDERDCLHIVGRKKEMIIRNGINLSPASIEEKILKTGKFKEATVFGVEDKTVGEAPVAVVVPKRKWALGDVEAILMDALPKIECPKHIYVLEALPRLSSGKVDKVSLKERFANKI